MSLPALNVSVSTTASFSLSFNPSPSQSLSIQLTPPSSVSVVGGNTITIASGQSSKTVTLQAGAVAATSQSIDFSLAHTTDGNFADVVVASAVSARVVGTRLIHEQSSDITFSFDQV